MPPEQALGGETTPQGDLYSLGCLLYELVTGRPPFIGEDPTAVIVRRAVGPLTMLAANGSDGDASPLGRNVYGIGDWTGSGELSLAFITTECGASNCVSRIEVQRWDGTAWRNAGPGNDFNNIKSATISLTGNQARLVVVAGTLGSVGAGPTRDTTSTFGVVDNAFNLLSAVPDKPVYLRHAIQDAEALFARGNFPAAVKAYEAAIADVTLRDRQKERNLPDGRPRLTGFALFRIAVATAASGADHAAAIDAAITTGKEPFFVETVQAFRRGLQERDGVRGGCIEVTRYLSDPAAREILRAIFDYGFANPPPGYLDICPL